MFIIIYLIIYRCDQLAGWWTTASGMEMVGLHTSKLQELPNSMTQLGQSDGTGMYTKELKKVQALRRNVHKTIATCGARLAHALMCSMTFGATRIWTSLPRRSRKPISIQPGWFDVCKLLWIQYPGINSSMIEMVPI